MTNDIEQSVHNLIVRYGTRDPFLILSYLNVDVRFSSSYKDLKGFSMICMRSCYVMINSNLTDEEQRVVAAHELGHIILHKATLSKGHIRDFALYDSTSLEEREANAFAAELLIDDADVLEFIESSPEEAADIFTISCIHKIPPELLVIKLSAMNKRGHAFPIFDTPDSRFLGRIKTYADKIHELILNTQSPSHKYTSDDSIC